MTARDPAARPDANQALELYTQWARKRWPVTQQWQLVLLDAGIFRRSYSSIISIANYFATRFRGLFHLLSLQGTQLKHRVLPSTAQV